VHEDVLIRHQKHISCPPVTEEIIKYVTKPTNQNSGLKQAEKVGHCRIIRLHRMHEMLTILTDVLGVSLSVCLSVARLILASLNSSMRCLG